jgi:outer membrane lipoprotein-sorting protein|tara:strand:- start:394 stop:1119 length:726 start_codon:yes stop_codon:yes gene_type:complete
MFLLQRNLIRIIGEKRLTSRLFIFVPLICFLLALAPETSGKTAPLPPPVKEATLPTILGQADKEDIARVESYLDAITTMTARFYQITSQGSVAEGWLYLSRPGKLRVNYNPPVPLQIIADGKNLIYYDSTLKSANTIGLDDTLAGVLLRSKLNLGSDVKVSGFSRARGVLRLNLTDSNNPDTGTLALTFSDKPLVLRKWSVTDSQGIVTTVALHDARFGMELDNKLFVFEDPSKFYIPFNK